MYSAVAAACIKRIGEKIRKVKRNSKYAQMWISNVEKGGKYKMKRKIVAILLVGVIVTSLSGCIEKREADMVSYNLSLEADNFNNVRQITVINCLQGDVLFQMTGKMSITADTSDKQLEIIVEDENGKYKKHFIGLSDNVTYVVEDITSKDVDKYNYTLNFNPNMWIPLDIKTVD